MSVSQVLDARAAGGLRNQPVAVGGFWSDGSVGLSCAAPVPWAQPGELELYCTDGLWGITELKEPVIVIDRDGYETPPSGPHLTPFIPNDLPGSDGLFSLPRVNGERYLLVPIVVAGHFDDPRAAQCRPAARQICLDRLVVDKIAYFNRAAADVWTATPSPVLPLGVSNGTSIVVTVLVNGRVIVTLNPGEEKTQIDTPVDPWPPLPWTIVTLSPSRRVLSTLTVSLTDYISDTSGRSSRVDLSCGRLDVWVGPRPLGGTFIPGTGGCD
jgi:hypothetical protein